jgi:hypothetical protein
VISTAHLSFFLSVLRPKVAAARTSARIHLQRSGSIEAFNHWEIVIPDLRDRPGSPCGLEV